jgi:hypothetical protein
MYMPAELYNVAYTPGANAIPLPHVNFIDKANTPLYVSTAVGGKRQRRRTKKRAKKSKKTRRHRRH